MDVHQTFEVFPGFKARYARWETFSWHLADLKVVFNDLVCELRRQRPPLSGKEPTIGVTW
jgi:hypothetical protein